MTTQNWNGCNISTIVLCVLVAIHHTKTDIDTEVENVTRSGLNIETLSAEPPLVPHRTETEKAQPHLVLVQPGLLQSGANTNSRAWCLFA